MKIPPQILEKNLSTVSPDFRPFVKAIIESDDDNVELYEVFADFLSERGDPRAELIRVQIALEDENANNRRELQQKEQQLLESKASEWYGAVERFIGKLEGPELFVVQKYERWMDSDAVRVTFRRGFPYQMTQRICLDVVENSMAYLPFGCLLRKFELDMDMYETRFDDLRQFPFSNVRELTISNGGQTVYLEESSAKLTECMPQLEVIDVSSKTERTFKILSAKFPHLRKLRLNGITELNTEALKRNQLFQALEDLEFHAHALNHDDEPYITTKSLADICESNLPNLNRLKIRCAEIGKEGLEILLNSSLYTQLKELELSAAGITDQAALLFVNAGHRLESLILEDNYISDETAAQIQNAAKNVIVGRQLEFNPNFADHLYMGDME